MFETVLPETVFGPFLTFGWCLLCTLLRSFVDLRLRSSALICVSLRRRPLFLERPCLGTAEHGKPFPTEPSETENRNCSNRSIHEQQPHWNKPGAPCFLCTPFGNQSHSLANSFATLNAQLFVWDLVAKNSHSHSRSLGNGVRKTGVRNRCPYRHDAGSILKFRIGFPFGENSAWFLPGRMAPGVDTELPYRVRIVDRGVDCRDPVCRHRFRFLDEQQPHWNKPGAPCFVCTPFEKSLSGKTMRGNKTERLREGSLPPRAPPKTYDTQSRPCLGTANCRLSPISLSNQFSQNFPG